MPEFTSPPDSEGVGNKTPVLEVFRYAPGTAIFNQPASGSPSEQSSPASSTLTARPPRDVLGLETVDTLCQECFAPVRFKAGRKSDAWLVRIRETVREDYELLRKDLGG